MPIHEFYLLPGDGRWDDRWAYEEYRRRLQPRLRKVDVVGIPMDLFDYIEDTLRWIPSINPANPRPWPGYGLNKFGPTIVNRAGAAMFGHVFESWAQLFSKAPERFHLTGNALLSRDGEDFRWTGGFAKYDFDRGPLVSNLRTLARYGAEVQSAECFIAHLGI